MTALFVTLLSLLGLSCAQFDRARFEFDSVARFDQFQREPARPDYGDVALRWPWVIRWFEGTGIDGALIWIFGVEPSPVDLENPSSFARERLELMAELSGHDVLKVAETSRRALWMLARDPQVLNQIVAIDRISAFMRELELDPLDVPPPAPNRAAAIESFSVQLSEFRQIINRSRVAETDFEGEFEQAGTLLVSLTERPAVRTEDDRLLLYALADALSDPGSESRLRDPIETGLRRAIHNGLSRALRSKLAATSEAVRENALLQLYRLSGADGLIYALSQIPIAAEMRRRFEPNPNLRRTWIQLLAQLRGEVIYESAPDGPSAIEFLYDTVRLDPEPALRSLALEAMARCLDRPVVADDTWAHEFWRAHSLERRIPASER